VEAQDTAKQEKQLQIFVADIIFHLRKLKLGNQRCPQLVNII